MKHSFLLLSLCSLILWFSSCSKSPEAVKSQETDKQIEANIKLKEQVARLMILPSEEPIIATVNEAELLRKEQPFYTGVINGDKLIIFPKAQKAIIYSPSKNIIINSWPFVINSDPTNSTESQKTTEPTKVSQKVQQ